MKGAGRGTTNSSFFQDKGGRAGQGGSAVLPSSLHRITWCGLTSSSHSLPPSGPPFLPHPPPGRVFYGVRPEIVALTEIPNVKGARARMLYKAGLRTPELVAASDVDTIYQIISAGVCGGRGRGGACMQVM